MFGKNTERRVFKEGSVCVGERENYCACVRRRDDDPLPISALGAFDIGILGVLYREEHVVGCEWGSIVKSKTVSKGERVRCAVFRYFVTSREIRYQVSFRCSAHESGIHKGREVFVRSGDREEGIDEAGRAHNAFGQRTSMRGRCDRDCPIRLGKECQGTYRQHCTKHAESKALTGRERSESCLE